MDQMVEQINETGILYIAKNIQKIPVASYDTSAGAVVLYEDSYVVKTSLGDSTKPYKSIIGAFSIHGDIYTYYIDKEATIIENESSSETYILLGTIHGRCAKVIGGYVHFMLDNTLLLADIKGSNVIDKLTGHTVVRIAQMNPLKSEYSGLALMGWYNSGGRLIMPLESSYNVLCSDGGVTDEITIDGESVFTNASLSIEGGTSKTDEKYKGLSSIVVNDKNIIIVDTPSKTSYTLPFYKNHNRATVIGDDVFIVNDSGLYILEKTYYDIFKCNVNIIGTGFSIYSVGNKIYIHNSKTHYELLKSTNTLIVTAYGVNPHGDIIGTTDVVTLKTETVSVNAPTFEGYMLNDEALKTVNTGGHDYCSVTFNYVVSRAMCTMNIEHRCFDDIFKREYIYGLVSDEYSVLPIDVEGYSFSHSSNCSGVFEKDVDTAKVYYTRTNISQNTNAVLDIEIESNTGYIRRTIGVLKSSNVSVEAIDINYHTPLEEVFVIGDITNSLYFDTREYSSSHNTKPADIFYNGVKVYEDFVLINDDDTVTTNLPYGMYPLVDVKNTSTSRLVINVDTNQKLNLMRFLDIDSINVISQIILPSTHQVLVPSIEGFEYQKTQVSTSGSLSITDVTYKKKTSSITIVRVNNDTGEELEIKRYVGPIGSSLFVKAYKIGDCAPTFKDMSIIFTHEDTVRTLPYTKESMIITYEYTDIYSNTVIDREVFIYNASDYVELEKPSRQKNKVIFSEVIPGTQVELSQTFKVFIYQTDRYDVPFTQNKSSVGFVNAFTKTSKFKQRLLTKAVSGDYLHRPLSVYLLKPISKSTKDYLVASRIGHYESYEKDLPSHGRIILINGDLDTGVLNPVGDVDCIYIPTNLPYKSFGLTVKFAMDCVNGDFQVRHHSKTLIKAKMSVTPKSYNAVSGDLVLNCNVLPSSIDTSSIRLDVYDPITLKKVAIKDATLVKAEPYNNFRHNANGRWLISRDFINVEDVKNYLYSNEINITATNSLGDSAGPVDVYVELYLKDLSTRDDFKKVYRPTVPRINNRLRGPRESLKVINFTRGINRACDDLEKLMKGSDDK